MLPLYLLTAVDVRLATEPDSSRVDIIEKMTIPPIKLATTPHNPGGGVIAVDYTQPRAEAIEPAFSVKGVDTSIFDTFGRPERWTFAGAYKDKRTGIDHSGRVTIEGVVAEWAPDESSPTEFQGCNHIIKEVTHFNFTLDGKELIYIDNWERVLRFKGQDLYAGTRSALGA